MNELERMRVAKQGKRPPAKGCEKCGNAKTAPCIWCDKRYCESCAASCLNAYDEDRACGWGMML